MLRGMGSFLVVQDEFKQADVIVVLGGGDIGRVKEAVKLYERGVSRYMIMTGGSNHSAVSFAEEMKGQAMRLGVPEEAIILEPKAMHTYEHPVFVKPILRARGFQSVIVVSSPYHMRRSAMLFNGFFRWSGIKLAYYPVQDSWFKVDYWWRETQSKRMVLREYMKMSVNIFGVRVSRFVNKLVGGKEKIASFFDKVEKKLNLR